MIDANLQMLYQMQAVYANYRSDANTWCQFQTSSTVLIDKNAVHMRLGGGVVKEQILYIVKPQVVFGDLM
jgi:hypothetical protein